MYQIVTVNDKIHLQDDQTGEYYCGEDGIPRPIWFATEALAKRTLNRLAKGKKVSGNLPKGVMDNRHRNWRRRSF